MRKKRFMAVASLGLVIFVTSIPLAFAQEAGPLPEESSTRGCTCPEDVTPPMISALPHPSTIECPAEPPFATPTATDLCDPSPILTFADVSTPGRCPPEYSVSRTWTATDACGNSSSARQLINVVDRTAPVISTLPDPSTIECPAVPQFATPTVTDPCAGPYIPYLTFKDVTTPGTCPQTHSVTRTWTATDWCGNSSSASQTITVDGSVPYINLNPTTLAFQAVQNGPLPLPQAFAISNASGGTLDWSVTDNASWLDETPTSGNSNSQTITVSVNTTTLAPGTYNAVVTVTSANAQNSPQTVSISYQIQSLPHISLSPPTLTFSAPQNGPLPPPQTFTITNTGGGLLDWSVASNQSWLVVTPPLAGQSNNKVVEVSVNTTALPLGTHTATLIVSSTNADNSPQIVGVTYNVSTPQAPAQPVITDVIDAGTGSDLVVKWIQPDKTGVTNYQVYFGMNSGNYIFGSVPIEEDGQNEYHFVLNGLTEHTPYFVAVRAHNTSTGLWSQYATPVPDTANYPTIPIVMVYGWSGSPSSWDQMNIWLRNDHFNCRWIADNIVSCGVTGEQLFDLNSKQLSGFIEHKQNEAGALTGIRPQRIALLAHSMGGMISRRYAAGNDPWGATAKGVTVQRLIMLGTPNGGVPIANVLWLKRRRMCWTNPPLCLALEIIEANLCSGPANREFATDQIGLFNGSAAINMYRGGIRYIGIAGNQYPPLMPIFLGNPNDGFVSKSSVLDAIFLQRAEAYDDHDFSPYRTHVLHSELPRHRVIYENFIRPELQNTAPSLEAAYKTPARAVSLDSASPLSYNYSTLGLVPPFSERTETLDVPNSQYLDVLADASGGALRFSMQSPSGTIFDSTYLEPDSSGGFSNAEGTQVFSIPTPESGKWLVHISSGALADTVWPYLIVAEYSDGVTMMASALPTQAHPDDTVLLSCDLRRGGSPILGASVIATAYSDSAEQVADLTLNDSGNDGDAVPGDGIYAAKWVPGSMLGGVSISVSAVGAPGPFYREVALTMTVDAKCYCPHQGDINGDGLMDVFDVIGAIGIAFAGDPDPRDQVCPTTRGDVDNNAVTDVFDVIYLIATAFSGGPNPVDPCGP